MCLLLSFALIANPGTLTPSPSLGSGAPLEPCNPLHNLLSPGPRSGEGPRRLSAATIMAATGDERRRARQLGAYVKHMPLHLSRNNPPYPEEVMSNLVELTVEGPKLKFPRSRIQFRGCYGKMNQEFDRMLGEGDFLIFYPLPP